MPTLRPRDLVPHLSLIVCYVLSGVFLLHLVSTGWGYAAPVWLPTGLALTAIVLGGKRMLPTIWIGAFLTNFLVQPELSWSKLGLAFAIGCGNTAEAAVMGMVLRKFKFSFEFRRLKDITGFITAAILGPLPSATLGIAAVSIAFPGLGFAKTLSSWLTWWVGDSLGALVFAPMLIVLLSRRPAAEKKPIGREILSYPIILLVLCFVGFGVRLPTDKFDLFLGFVFYSSLIWCALTLRIQLLFFVTALASSVMIALTYLGVGLFGDGEVVLRLTGLQFFLGCISVTMMLVSAVVSERFAAQELAYQREKSLIRAEKMSSLGEMTSGIAHEISNPLMVIYARTEQALLLLQRGQLESEKLKPILEKIDSTARRIDQVIKSISFFSRSSDRDPFRTFRVKEIVDEALHLCQDLFSRNGVELIVDPVCEKISVECKPVLIGQVVLNLLNNAQAAALENPARWVRISCKSTDTDIEIAIVDSGKGIAAENRDKIFHPFFTTKMAGKGTGLGLSISRNIVEAHHGSIALDADHPNTRFVVSLPIQQPRVEITRN